MGGLGGAFSSPVSFGRGSISLRKNTENKKKEKITRPQSAYHRKVSSRSKLGGKGTRLRERVLLSFWERGTKRKGREQGEPKRNLPEKRTWQLGRRGRRVSPHKGRPCYQEIPRSEEGNFSSCRGHGRKSFLGEGGTSSLKASTHLRVC